MNGTHQLNKPIKLLGKYMDMIRKRAEASLVASNKVGPEINAVHLSSCRVTIIQDKTTTSKQLINPLNMQQIKSFCKTHCSPSKLHSIATRMFLKLHGIFMF